MRLFIGAELNGQARGAVARAAVDLRRRLPAARFVDAENLHVTLHFLGECHREAEVRGAMDEVTCSPFGFVLSGMGVFPSAQVCWMGVEAAEGLAEAHRQLGRALANRGFRLEGRLYRPHLTLARKVAAPPRGALEAAARAAGDIPVTVGHLTLFHSHRVDGVLTYSPIYRKPLGPGPGRGETD